MPPISVALGGYAFIGGLLTLVGWFANIPRLTDWDNNGIAMMPNAAVCALGAGAALLLRALLGLRGPVIFLGVFAGLIGLGTLFEHLSGINLGIDTIFVRPAWGMFTVAPGRMGLPGATSWTVIGLSLALMTGGPRSRRAAAAGGMLAATIAMLSIVGYFFNASLLFTLPRLTAIALQTATIILALSIGIVATLRDQQPMKTLGADTMAGLLARRALPFIIFFPLTLGWLRVRGQEAGWYDTAFGTALGTIVELVLLLALLWWALAIVSAKGAALRRERERVTETLESITDGFHVIDAAGRFTYFNSAARKMFAAHALDTEALMSRPIFEVFPEARETEIGRAIQRTLNDHIATDTQSFYAPWRQWFNARNYPTPEGGVATYFQDITARMQTEKQLREGEKRFRVAVEAVSDIVWTNNAQGQMEGEQPGWGKFTGQTLEAYQGYGWSKAVHSEDAQPTLDAWNKAVAEKRTFEFEHRVRRHDGQWRSCSIRALPVIGADGSVREWVGVHTDITERKRSEEALEKSHAELFRHAEELRRASRAKDHFLAALSHELRTPLNPALLVASESANNLSLPEDVRQDFQIVLKNIQIEAQLIDDLLDVTRIASGKLALEKRPVDIHTVLKDAFSTVKSGLEQKEIELATRLAAFFSFVDGDPVRLQQVFWNILNNAVKFTPPKGRISVDTFNDGAGLLTVKISDSGIGMNSGEIARIFNPFAQGEHAAGGVPQRFGGLGLGLAISKNLVELHSGKITAESSGLNQGSTFFLELPLMEAGKSQLDEAQTGQVGNDDEEKPTIQGRISSVLLVEDHGPTRGYCPASPTPQL